MLNSKVIDILKSFSDEEIKKFSEFLNSPFHNKNKKAVKLFEFLSAFHPDYDSKNLSKEKIFVKIISDNKSKGGYSDVSVRNVLSDLLILAEKFLAYTNFENDRFYFNRRILSELSERKLAGVFDKRLKITEEILNEKEFDGEEEFYRKFLTEELKSSSSQYFDNLKLYKTEFNLNASEYLTYFYLIKIFKSVNFFAFQKQFNIEPVINTAEKILKDLNTGKILDSVKLHSERDYEILSVYYSLYQSFKNPENDSFYLSFKNNVLKNENLFSPLEKYGLYVCLTNNCVQKIDLGKEEFFKECFEVYRLMFEKNLFDVYPGYFPMTAFTAVLQTGLSSDEYKLTEEFINEYSSRLNPEHREDAVNYAFAQLNFYKKDFSKALEFISRTDTEFSQFKYHLKALSLKIFYETGDYDSLYYASDSFIHFLNKNKLVSGNYKTEYSNFVKILDLLVKYKLSKEKKYFLRIEEMLEKIPSAGKKWLREKFSEL